MSGGGRIRVLLTLELRPGTQADFERLWRAHAEAISGLPASLGQSLSRRIDSDTGYVVLTDWADEPSFREFEKSRRQREYLEQLWPMRVSGSMTLLLTVSEPALNT